MLTFGGIKFSCAALKISYALVRRLYYVRGAMTPAEIDGAIIASADARFLKVAMVVITAANKLGLRDTPGGDDTVAERLYALVAEGRLLAVGDVTRWRHSEVRLP